MGLPFSWFQVIGKSPVLPTACHGQWLRLIKPYFALQSSGLRRCE
jgi:hypothetical protein